MLALVNDRTLEPGERVLTFDYMGQRYEADLLADGMIFWNDEKYSSPYAWASQCKNLVNPDHKTGIGWGHIRYKGIKLSQYKNIYMKKHHMLADSDEEVPEVPSTHEENSINPKKGRKRKQHAADVSSFRSKEEPLAVMESTSFATSMPATSALAGTVQTPPLLHCSTTESIGIQELFAVSVMSNVLLLMDFHSHMTQGEVMGYLGGTYDSNTKVLEVLQAFPCVCEAHQSAKWEQEIQASMLSRGLRLVGWYHSHPASEPRPSENDVICQQKYQETMMSGENGIPCIALITSPNLHGKLASTQTLIKGFWVLSFDVETVAKVLPMELSFTTTWEQYLTQDVVDEMGALAARYKNRPNAMDFKAIWKDGCTLLTKLKTSLSAVQPHFPQENSNETFMGYVDQLVQ
eukprot:Em0012g1067a